MSQNKTPQHNPDPQNLPGEVERDNDALRPNVPTKGKQDSTAQEAAKGADPKHRHE